MLRMFLCFVQQKTAYEMRISDWSSDVCSSDLMVMALPDGTDPADGASCFVNPLTSLAFTETMRMENHSAIVHTAAASNLGQMLVKICAKDGIPLVNIVRSDAQVDILKSIGAKYIVNSSADDFMERLIDAIAETGATLGFDATGGGKLAGQILTAMEAAAVKRMTTYSRYGPDTLKQVYIYGALDLSTTTFSARSFGLTDRKRVVKGKGVSVRGDIGGRRILKNKNKTEKK